MGFAPTQGDMTHEFMQHAFNQQLALTLNQDCPRSQEECGQQDQYGP